MIVSDEKSEEASASEEKKEYTKAQIETITEESGTDSKKAPDSLGHTENYFTVISEKQKFKIEKMFKKPLIWHRGD